MSFSAINKNKILVKISDFTVTNFDYQGTYADEKACSFCQRIFSNLSKNIITLHRIMNGILYAAVTMYIKIEQGLL